MKHQPTVALWIYQDLGGEKITDLLKKHLEDHGLKVITGFDLRKCSVIKGQAYTEEGICLNKCQLLFQMNADEQSQFQNNILQILEMQGVIVVNSTISFNLAKDKLLSNILLDRSGIKVPMTISLDRDLTDAHIKNLCDQWPAILLKPKGSHGGKGIVKWSDFDQLRDGWSLIANRRENYYLECFIPFDDHDFRIEIVNNQYAGGYSRQKSHAFKTNISANGGLMGLRSPESCIDIARKAVRTLQLDCSIVDMVRHRETGEYYVLEVNPALGVFNESAIETGVPIYFKGEESYKNDRIKLSLVTELILCKLKYQQKRPLERFSEAGITRDISRGSRTRVDLLPD